MIKKSLFSTLVVIVLGVTQAAYAANVASFVVEVNPSTAGINQAVDLKVKAVDSNGAVVKDYANNIFVEVGGIKDLQDVTIPSDGIYTFTPQDQGEKVFSKGLKIGVAGTYTILVSDIDVDTIKGQTQIVIDGGAQQTQGKSTITFSSPIQNGTETNPTVSVVGNAGIKNAKVQILLNNTKVKEEQANANGDFTSFLTDLTAGQYVLQAIVKDVNDNIVAQSENTNFTYQPAQIGEIKSFDVTPSKTLKQGQKATFTVKLGADTTSVELTLKDESGKEQKLPLDKTSAGVFQKSLLMDIAGSYKVSVDYSMNAATKTQPDVATISVLEGKGIKEVTYIVDPIDKSKLTLKRAPIGDVEYVLAQYGTQKDALVSGVVLTGSTGLVTGLDISEKSYYVRLFPADSAGKIIGEPSDIVLVEQVQGSAPVCRVSGITVNTTKVGDQYFLTWKAAENAERYVIYRSDRPARTIAEMQKVGETSDTKFPYPFDAQAQKEGYAYYAVVAICQDGNGLQLGGTKKVKVGPATNMILIFLISLMIFGIYRMRKIND